MTSFQGMLPCFVTFTLVLAATLVFPTNADKTMDQILMDANSGDFTDLTNEAMSGGSVVDSRGDRLVELDMVVSKDQFDAFHGKQSSRSKRLYNYGRSMVTTWPKKTLVYKLSGMGQGKRVLESAFQEIERHTCIRFRQKMASDYNYVDIVNPAAFGKRDGCHSKLGYRGGRQLLSLGPGCHYRGVYIHELLHALGVIHEHQQSNRDNHLNIQWQNIQGIYRSQFQKYSSGSYPRYDIPYSYNSIMHYSSKAFSSNGGLTMVPKISSWTSKIGQIHNGQKGLSQSDKQLLNKMYTCNAHCSAADQQKCGVNEELDDTCKCTTKRTTPKPESLCQDQMGPVTCKRYKDSGYCNSYSPYHSYALTYCKRSCGKCGGNPRTTATPATTTPATITKGTGPCEDSSYFSYGTCDSFKRKRYCITSDTVRRHCMKTCGVCTDTSTPSPFTTKRTAICTNDFYGCDGWAKSNMCNLALMKTRCPKACGLC